MTRTVAICSAFVASHFYKLGWLASTLVAGFYVYDKIQFKRQMRVQSVRWQKFFEGANKC
jgi:hypothetical protein